MPVCLRLCSAEKSAGRKSGGRFSFLPAAGGYAVFRVVFGRRVAPDGRGTQPPPAEFCFCRKQRPSVLGAAEGLERGGQGTICPLLAVVKNLFWQQAKTLPPAPATLLPIPDKKSCIRNNGADRPKTPPCHGRNSAHIYSWLPTPSFCLG